MTLLAWELAGISLVAGFAHGVSGFGFPLISTPVVALLVDVRTAVIVTLLPNVAVNLISLVRGGNWRTSLGAYWPVAAYVVVGTVIGTQLILIAPPTPLKILLAVVIIIYLKQSAFTFLNWDVVRQHPKLGGAFFGLFGGVLSGTVNVALPPLLIYFSVLGLAPIAMTQILNLCFLAGRMTQIAALGGVGEFGASVILLAAPAVVSAVVGLMIGARLQLKVAPAQWRLIIRGVLWLLASLMIGQVLVSMVR
jgi:uncharacterized membrane protein YfcA